MSPDNTANLPIKPSSQLKQTIQQKFTNPPSSISQQSSLQNVGKKIFLILAFWLVISYLFFWSLYSVSLFFAIAYEPFTFIDLFTTLFKNFVSFPVSLLYAILAFGHPENTYGGLLLITTPILLLTIIIGVVIYFTSKLRKLFLILLPLLSGLLALVSFIYFYLLQTGACDYWTCEKIEIIAYLSGFIVVGTISLIPFAYVLKNNELNLKKAFSSSILPGLLSIIFVFGIWYIGAYLPAMRLSKATDIAVTSRTENQLSEAKTESNFLEPTYIPEKFCGQVHQQLNEGKIETFYSCSSDKIGDLLITQLNLSKISSYLNAKNITELKEDLDKSRAESAYSSKSRLTQWRWSSYEDTSVNGKPALFIYTSPQYADTISDHSKKLIFFTQASRVEIATNTKETYSDSSTKDELIKIAEGLAPSTQ